ncbi:MAG: DNA-processing protein DprA [Candidatus Gastranaerophilales bacterium]|nr:DNA-processing protein DprA [Candidatus Gastranaerophilales bacterium]
MDEIKYWLGFAKLEFLGSTSILKMYSYFNSIKEAWLCSRSDLYEIEGLKQNVIEKFCQEKNSIELNKLEDEINERNIQVITVKDEIYPELLKQIYNSPAVLFAKGNLNSCNLEKTLAVIGSRKCSHYIQEILPKIIEGLRGTDITIVSGMALGVDTIGHEGAINNNLKTIAVLGGGFDQIYPSKNKGLFEKIINGNGAVLSEYYPTERPETWKFPHRNRIVSGLSKGTLIGEASLKSGALITAKLALEQNRELMCIPGLVTNPNTKGNHYLLKTGAGLVGCADDILEHMGWEKNEGNFQNFEEKNLNLLDNEEKIYQTLSLEPLRIDEISNKLKLNIGDTMISLTSMELQGIIKQLPGEKYIKVL